MKSECLEFSTISSFLWNSRILTLLCPFQSHCSYLPRWSCWLRPTMEMVSQDARPPRNCRPIPSGGTTGTPLRSGSALLWVRLPSQGVARRFRRREVRRWHSMHWPRSALRGQNGSGLRRRPRWATLKLNQTIGFWFGNCWNFRATNKLLLIITLISDTLISNNVFGK